MIKTKVPLLDLGEKLQKIRSSSGDLSTSCCRQCGCCRVACPQMKYSEALQILNHIWNQWERKDIRELLVTSVRYFFSRSLIKPCPLLKNNGCGIYNDRPINCSLYGLWPKDVYQKRVENLAKKLDLKVEQIPLNTQCPFVKPISGKFPTEQQIEYTFNLLDDLDFAILSAPNAAEMAGLNEEEKKALVIKRQKEWKMKIKHGWNYRVLHDWILVLFWGEEALIKMTSIAMSATPEQLEDLINNIALTADTLLDSLEKK